MRKAKSRLKPKSANERAEILSVVLGSIVLGYLVMGAGQIKTMIDTWHALPRAEASEPMIVETRERGYSEKQLIMDYIVELFGDDANLAITMLTKCENNKLDPEAYNYNNNGTEDSGVFQINSIHATREEMIVWRANIEMAHKIYKAGGNKFTAWTCAGVIGQTNYLGE